MPSLTPPTLCDAAVDNLPQRPQVWGKPGAGVCVLPPPTGSQAEWCLGGCLDPEELGKWTLQGPLLDLSAAPQPQERS